MNNLSLRIHGDNILECERALELISNSLNSNFYYRDSPIYAPIYDIAQEDKAFCSVQLFPGYNRHNVDIQEIMKQHGAPIREATDVIITKVIDTKEEILFSIEFCNALPAGNNAWQRTGRALACASVNIPYLYFADIGGVELDEKRKLKAHRFPNPIIPFSYITLGKNYDSVSIPIYLSSPSSPEDIKTKFVNAFGEKEGLELVGKLILNKDEGEIIKSLNKKGLELVKLLSNQRKREDTLRGGEWDKFLDFDSVADKANWLESLNKTWSKKSSSKVQTTSTFKSLLKVFKENEILSIGADEIPICLIRGNTRRNIARKIKELYGDKLNDRFLEWLNKDEPLIIVWVTGFKPRGDDSRPDRGLVPMARMLFGPDIEVLTVVYGPAKSKMLAQLEESTKKLAEQNGLWEGIINLSDAILADSIGSPSKPINLILNRSKKIFRDKITFSGTKHPDVFSEHDVDSVIHFFFTHSDNKKIFESMCNPPGGDWSGLSFWNYDSNEEYRWTSLPRVSKSQGKRPDHVIEIGLDKDKVLMLSIESKDSSSLFDNGIGPRLNRYTKDLIKGKPNIIKNASNDWKLIDKTFKLPKSKLSYSSGGAFCYKNLEELYSVLKSGNLDFVLALEFIAQENKVKIHAMFSDKNNPLIGILKNIKGLPNQRLEIQIY